jgi:hypothetical protein
MEKFSFKLKKGNDSPSLRIIVTDLLFIQISHYVFDTLIEKYGFFENSFWKS